jgi:hydrogenase maturation protease
VNIQVLGFGNPLRGDDGIGVRVAEALACRYPELPAASFRSFGLGALATLVGKGHAVLVDGVESDDLEIGEIAEVSLPNRTSPAAVGSHAMRVRDLLELGERLGLPMPQRMSTLGIGIRGPFPLSEGLSEPLDERFGDIVNQVARFVFSETGEGR